MVFFGIENGDVIVLDVEIGEICWEIIILGEVFVVFLVDEGILVVNIGVGVMFGLDMWIGE